MIKHAESHFDHGLTEAQVDHVMQRFADREAFFIATIELPEALGTVPCGLHGPITGDAPIAEVDVTYAKRGARTWDSRLVDRPAQQVRTVTVIAGPHAVVCSRHPECDGKVHAFHGGADEFYPCEACNGQGTVKYVCIVFTMYGGPLAPQEPGDLKAQKNAVEAQRLGLSDLSDEHKALTAKRDALREKLAASRTFWAEHALTRG